MKPFGTVAALMFAGIDYLSCAQAGDTLDHSRACAQIERTGRLGCVAQISEAPEQSIQAPPQSPNWVMSETTSPVDYKPQIAAQTIARAGAKDFPPALAIHCRADRTELLLSAAATWTDTPATDVKVVLEANGQPPVAQRWKVADGGRRLTFQGDAIRLIRSIPATGHLLVKVYAGPAPPNENVFELIGLNAVRQRLAEVCTWPR